MKDIIIEKDILLVCKRVKDFPKGAPNTFKELGESLDGLDKRTCYGIFEEIDTEINYRAAFSALETDNLETHSNTFTIEKGTYLSKSILDFYSKIDSIGSVFSELFENENVDKKSASIEIYQGNTLICMVKKK